MFFFVLDLVEVILLLMNSPLENHVCICVVHWQWEVGVFCRQNHQLSWLCLAYYFLAPWYFGLTPSLAQRQLWPDTHFGPEILRPETFWPGNTSARNNFGPENTLACLYTSARKQLRPREYFGLLIYFGPEILRPARLRPAPLRPRDQTFKSVIFHHFWPGLAKNWII